MVDTRFHPVRDPLSLAALLAGVNFKADDLDPRAADLLIEGADELSLAGTGHIAFAAHARYADAVRQTRAGAVIVLPSLRDAVPSSVVAIATRAPHELFVDLIEALYPRRPAFTAADPSIEGHVVLGPNVVIGAGVEIGTGTVIGPNTVIGAGVSIGRNCVIGANCTIDCAYLGNDVVLFPGVRIGTEGFGWLDFGRTNRKVPQLGRVIVQDKVEIGANSTVDRGALGDTVIGEGTKIDNLVQVGHNSHIGRYCLIAALSGIAGSTILEDGVLMAGGAATAGHLTVGAGSIVHGRAAVSHSWPPGSKLAGTPAQDIKGWFREIAALRRLARGGKGDKETD